MIPIPGWGRLVAVALAAAIVFGAGWKVNGWRLESSHQRAMAEQQALEAQRLAAYAAEIERLNKADRKAAAAHQARVASLNGLIDNLKRDRVANANNDTGTPGHPFTVGFVRELNRLSDSATGELPRGEAAAPRPAGDAGDTGATSTVTREQLLDWYTQVVKQYAVCREQILAIKAWEGESDNNRSDADEHPR
jgi:hypothetical protein